MPIVFCASEGKLGSVTSTILKMKSRLGEVPRFYMCSRDSASQIQDNEEFQKEQPYLVNYDPAHSQDQLSWKATSWPRSFSVTCYLVVYHKGC